MPMHALAPGLVAPGTLLDPTDLEKLLKVDRRTVRRWVAQRLFPAPLRPGGHRPRWRAADVLKYLEGLDAAPAVTAHSAS